MVRWMNFEQSRPAVNPRIKMTDLACESACTTVDQPSPFIVITKPVRWLTFYRPREGEVWALQHAARAVWRNGFRDKDELITTGFDAGPYVPQLRVLSLEH